MVLRVLMFTLLFARAWQADPVSLFPPTKGQVWPIPQHEKKELNLFKFNKANFAFVVLNNTCKTLTDAVGRVRKELYKMHQITEGNSRIFKRYLQPTAKYRAAVLDKMEIKMRGPCEKYPYLGMDESYNLTVSTKSKLTSPSLWGLLRGLETFVQLFYVSDDYKNLLVNGTSIYDFPRYPHRGLLLDTARHYLTTGAIKTTLDAMAMNKLNVFHWHIVDDQSFPYQSKKYPEMSEKGAFHSTMVYTKSDIVDIVNYARDRGIRVIPEMDVPGHTRSWGKAFPEVLTECFVDEMELAQGPLNPTSEFTYKLLGDLFKEAQQWFPDEYFHLGGDEIDTRCWEMCSYLSDYSVLKSYNLTEPREFLRVFFSRVIPLLRERSKPILWQDVFDEGVALPDGTLIQIWKEDWAEKLNIVLSQKMRVVHSTEWYLDKTSEWEKMYLIDPRSLVNDVSQLDNLVGGEACMWGEHVDSNNLISRVWPKASAVAERLWSNAILDDAIKRLNPNPSDQTSRSVQQVLDHPREPVYQPGVHTGNEVVEEVEIDRKSGNVDALPHQASKNIEPVSQTGSSLDPMSQTSSILKPASQTSGTFQPVSQITNSLEPMSETRKLMAVTDRLENMFEKANLVMEQLLLKNDLNSVRSRLEEHACRMIRRGVPAEPPNGPGFCVV